MPIGFAAHDEGGLAVGIGIHSEASLAVHFELFRELEACRWHNGIRNEGWNSTLHWHACVGLRKRAIRSTRDIEGLGSVSMAGGGVSVLAGVCDLLIEEQSLVLISREEQLAWRATAHRLANTRVDDLPIGLAACIELGRARGWSSRE